MGAEQHEEGVRRAAREMDRDGARMEHELERLGEHIDEAQAAKEKRPEAGSDAIADVAGDWEDEAMGSQQGEDAEDTERPQAGEA